MFKFDVTELELPHEQLVELQLFPHVVVVSPKAEAVASEIPFVVVDVLQLVLQQSPPLSLIINNITINSLKISSLLVTIFLYAPKNNMLLSFIIFL